MRILKNQANAGFSPKAAYIFKKQIEEADFVIVNRIDELPPAQVNELAELVSKQYPGRPPLRIPPSPAKASMRLLHFLKQRGDFGRE